QTLGNWIAQKEVRSARHQLESNVHSPRQIPDSGALRKLNNAPVVQNGGGVAAVDRQLGVEIVKPVTPEPARNVAVAGDLRRIVAREEQRHRPMQIDVDLL